MEKDRDIFKEIGDTGIMVSRDGNLIFNKYTNKIYSQYYNGTKCRYKMVGLSFRGRSAEFVHYIVSLAWMPELLGEGKEIHHCDLNTQNNSVDNLVVLDREVHKKIHKLLRQKANLDDIIIDLLKRYKNEAA